MDRFTSGYVGAALWSSNLEGKGEISRDCLDQMKADCAAFQRAYGNLIDAASTPDMNVRGRKLRHSEAEKQERAGADFFLTRNREGAGFWDGDWSEPQATALTNAAHRFGEFQLIMGDDGEIDCYPPPNSRMNPLDSSDLVMVGLGVALLGAVGFAIYQYKQTQAAQAIATAQQTQAQQMLAQSLQNNPFGQ